MKRKPLSTSGAEQKALYALLQLIVARDRQGASLALAKSPSLARIAVIAGATRENPKDYFFEQIAHYAYSGDTALHIASAAYERDVARELVSKGANVRARNRRGAEPLHYAADGGPGARLWNPDAQFGVVEFLIGAGADPNSEDNSGVAPLHRAVRTRCTAAVHALLKNGADVRRRNGSGSTPLHLAVQTTGRGGSGSAVAREEQAKIIRILLGSGASPSDKDSSGKAVRDYVKSDWIRAALANP